MIQGSHSWAHTQKKIKILIQKDTGTPMFTVVPFTRAKTWKEPKCPSTDEWMEFPLWLSG